MVVVLVLNHLRCHVLKSTTESVPLLHVVSLDAPTEITNLYNVAILDQDVLRLNVSVNQPLLVEVVNA